MTYQIHNTGKTNTNLTYSYHIVMAFVTIDNTKCLHEKYVRRKTKIKL